MNIDQINKDHERAKDELWREFGNDLAKFLAVGLIFGGFVLLLIGVSP